MKTHLPDEIWIGREGEQYSRSITFDISVELSMWGNATPTLIYVRPGEKVAYPATTTLANGILTWIPDGFVTAIRGARGFIQIIFTESADETVIIGKSKVMRMQVCESLNTSAEPPEPWETWIEDLLDAAAQATTAATNATEAAQDATDAAADARSAVQEAEATVSALNARVTEVENELDSAERDIAGIEGRVTEIIGEVTAEGTTQVRNVQNEGTTQVGNVSSEGTTQIGLVGAEGTRQIGLVIDEGTTQIGLVSAEGTRQVGLVEEAGAEEIAVISTSLVNKADVICDTASGAIASFPDGANNLPIKNMTVDIVPTETGSGTKSSENPYVIGGWTSAKLHCTGSNLLGGTDLRDEIQTNYPGINYNAEGQYLYATAPNLSNKTLITSPFKNNLRYTTIITFHKNTGTAPNMRFLYTDGGTGPLAWGVAGEIATRATTSPSNKSVKMVQGGNYSGTTSLYYMQSGIFLGEKTVDDYEAYKGKIITLSFGSTIYGGQISIAQNGTVKLKVYPYYSSYNGEELTGKWISSMDEYVAGTTPTTGAFVVDLSGQYTEEITLDPITPIKTLLGVNNLWADTGDVSVNYRADTKLYIDKKVASIVQP